METQLGIDENDVFYMDLKRQMLVLTSDDGDEEQEEEEQSFKPRTSVYANNFFPATSSQASWLWRDQYVDPMLFMQVNLQKSNSGTGVFIPQIMSNHSMRKHKCGRKKCRKSQNSEKRKIQQVGSSGK